MLVDELYKNDNGIVGPNVYCYNEPKKITYIGGNINFYTGKITHPYLNISKRDLIKNEIDYICGCSLLIKKEVINKVGLLEPSVFSLL